MDTRRFDEFEVEAEVDKDTFIAEATPSKKLERRRKIEDLFEEKRLEDELKDFA